MRAGLLFKTCGQVSCCEGRKDYLKSNKCKNEVGNPLFKITLNKVNFHRFSPHLNPFKNASYYFRSFSSSLEPISLISGYSYLS